MKHSTVVKTLAISLLPLSVISCKKKTSTPVDPNPTTNTFTYKLDGAAAVTIDSANAVMYNYDGSRLIDVYAYKGGTEVLEFHFDPKTGAKTAGTTLGTGALMTYMESPTSSYDSQSGTLNLTTCDTVANKIEGDFNFVGKQAPYTGGTTKTISEGHMIVTRLTKQ